MCNMLNLKQVYDADLTVFNEHCYEIWAMFSALDEQAIHTLKTVLKIEYERCTKGVESQMHGELSVASKSLGYAEDSL